MPKTKRTPCVGICSTTFGDLVCRGCKRFAHEIVAWNSYDEGQQQLIWNRLNGLRDQVVAQLVRVVDPVLFEAACMDARLEALEGPDRTYQLLRHLVRRDQDLNSAGLAAHADDHPDALSLMQAIDGEVFVRSMAHYERSFKVLV